MLNYVKVAKSPVILRYLTGLSPDGFGQLLVAFTPAYEQAQAVTAAKRREPRQRAVGGGRQAILATMADKLLFILFYFRLYPTQVALGFFFGFSQAQANFCGFRNGPGQSFTRGGRTGMAVVSSVSTRQPGRISNNPLQGTIGDEQASASLRHLHTGLQRFRT